MTENFKDSDDMSLLLLLLLLSCAFDRLRVHEWL